MGLDIVAYSNIKKERKIEDEDDEYENYDITIYSNSSFVYQLGSLNVNTHYSKTKNSKVQSFRIGSYSTYNGWRNDLSIMAGYISAESVWDDFKDNLRYYKLKEIINEKVIMKPFYEIIFFSDCDGVIGPEISKKLYDDFLLFDETAKKENEYFYRIYSIFKDAFKIASDNGLVLFG